MHRRALILLSVPCTVVAIWLSLKLFLKWREKRHPSQKLRIRGLINCLRSFKAVASTAHEVDEEEDNEEGKELNDVNEAGPTFMEFQSLDLCTVQEYSSNDANEDMTDYTTESTSSSTLYPSSSDGRSTLNSATESVDNLNDSDSDDNNGRLHPKIPFDSDTEMRFSNSDSVAKKILRASSSEVFYECLGSPVIRPYHVTPTTKPVTPPCRASKQLIVKNYEDSIKVRTCYGSGTSKEAAPGIQINESVRDLYDSYHDIVTPNKPYTEPRDREVTEHSSDCDNDSSKLNYDEAIATHPLNLVDLNYESKGLGQNAGPRDTAKSEGQMQKNVTDIEGKTLRDSMAIMKRGHKIKKLLSDKSSKQQECTQNVSLQRESPEGSEARSGRSSPTEISNDRDHLAKRQKRRSFIDKLHCSLI